MLSWPTLHQGMSNPLIQYHSSRRVPSDFHFRGQKLSGSTAVRGSLPRHDSVDTLLNDLESSQLSLPT